MLCSFDALGVFFLGNLARVGCLLIKLQNDHIEKLDAKIAEHELENENFKFARSMLYNGRRPGIQDGIGFQQGDNVQVFEPLCLAPTYLATTLSDLLVST